MTQSMLIKEAVCSVVFCSTVSECDGQPDPVEVAEEFFCRALFTEFLVGFHHHSRDCMESPSLYLLSSLRSSSTAEIGALVS